MQKYFFNIRTPNEENIILEFVQYLKSIKVLFIYLQDLNLCLKNASI